MAAGMDSEYAAKLAASSTVRDEVVLQASILLELRELNERLARAELLIASIATGKSAKWLALIAKSNMGSGR